MFYGMQFLRCVHQCGGPVAILVESRGGNVHKGGWGGS